MMEKATRKMMNRVKTRTINIYIPMVDIVKKRWTKKIEGKTGAFVRAISHFAHHQEKKRDKKQMAKYVYIRHGHRTQGLKINTIGAQ